MWKKGKQVELMFIKDIIRINTKYYHSQIKGEHKMLIETCSMV